MKPIDQSLQRLLNAAAHAPDKLPEAAPLGLETRVLAHWRTGSEEEDVSFLLAFFRRAVFCACLLLALSAAWSLTRPGHDTAADEVALANYPIHVSFWP